MRFAISFLITSLFINGISAQSFKTVMKYAGDLYTNYNRAVSIKYLSKGDSVNIKAFSPIGKTYYVITSDTVGWVYEGNIERTYELVTFQEDTKASRNKGRYWIGMTNSDATSNLGLPTRVSKMTGTWGKTETWYYKEKGLYLILDDDKVTSYFYN